MNRYIAAAERSAKIAAANAYFDALSDSRECDAIAAAMNDTAAARPAVFAECAAANARAARLLICKIEKHNRFGAYENVPAIAAVIRDLLSDSRELMNR